jgi:hypothetical protein
MEPMIAFHIDMNIAQFTRAYLEKLLSELARLGYNAVIWEVENNIAWDTCPECRAAEAFSKAEFRQIVDRCRQLNLEPIPLLQTIGHCEYVLKHERYKPLAEVPSRIDQYCPRNEQVMPFLHRWIEEYYEVFGDVKHFHLGADEAYTLGHCPRCKAFAQEHSLSQLYIDHINEVARPVLARGGRPIIWADMALHYNEALDRLSRQIMLFDWNYGRYHGSGWVAIWGRGGRRADTLTREERLQYGKYMFPHGDEQGREPDPFYTADYLAEAGFDVVICPGSMCYGNNVFTPRNWLHVINTYDSFNKALQAHMAGGCLTSWTVHLTPYELQWAPIDLAPWVRENPAAPVEMFQPHFVRQRFGCDDWEPFWTACGLLSKASLFTHTASLGYDKAGLPVPLDHVKKTLEKLDNEGHVEKELINSQDRLEEYLQGLSLLAEWAPQATTGKEILDWWLLAARNLVNRAQATIFLLDRQRGGHPAAGRKVLQEMQFLREQMFKAYEPVMRPTRRREAIDWIFASMLAAMEAAAG